MLASLEDRYGAYPDFMLMRPHVFATISDPRFAKMYSDEKNKNQTVRERSRQWVKEEIERMEIGRTDNLEETREPSGSSDNGDFWGTFDKEFGKKSNCQSTSIDTEIDRWLKQEGADRTANPIELMEHLKKDFPRIYRLFRKFSIFPCSQNKDERLFSLVARNTGPRCRNIKVETIEKKVVVGSAIQKHGFRFNYQNGNASSSEEDD